MYAIVLATALTSGSAAPELGWGKGCYGCHGCYGCGGCYSCYGCTGCSGCYSCYGCTGWGGCRGCHCSCYGCSACHGCSACYGCYCSGCSCSGCSCWGCYASVPVYYGCSCFGCSCFGCGGAVAPSTGTPGRMNPAGQTSSTSSEEVRLPATVVIKAPTDITVSVNGQATQRRAAEETFQTPALVSGQEYTYQVTAEATRDGRKVSQTRRIVVRAGERSTVEFGDLRPPAAARVTVVLPARARLVVNGATVSAAAGAQTFETPALESGRRYYYTIEADVERDGRTVRETRRVEVESGKDVRVDFTPAAVRTARR